MSPKKYASRFWDVWGMEGHQDSLRDKLKTSEKSLLFQFEG